MKHLICLLIIAAFLAGCASNVKFIRIDENYVIQPKDEEAEIVFKMGEIKRSHKVIGVIQAELDKKARKEQLNALIIKKAREIGADGVMSVEYDVDKEVYWEQHHAVVGRGPWKRHVVTRAYPNVTVRRTASAIAVIFE